MNMTLVALICFLISIVLFVENIIKIFETNTSDDLCLFGGALFCFIGWMINLFVL